MTITTVNRANNPYPVKCSSEQWELIERFKESLLGFPKYAEILRAAVHLGLQQMSTMGTDELCKLIRSYGLKAPAGSVASHHRS